MQRANVIQPTYYDILEVANDATAAEIFHAYGIKAKKAHPKNNAADTAALFAQINAAYAHLVDFSTRMDYDASIGLISQHAILQNEKFKLDDLPALLRLNRLDEIRAIIQDVKAVDKMKWQDKDIVKHTVMDAVISGNMAALELFLAEGFVPNCSVDLNPTRKGRVKPIVYFAAITNNLPMVKLMLECCYSIDKDTYHTDMNRDSALKAAVKKDNYDMVEYLLAKGASADNHFGNSMRMEPYVARAARYADHRMIALLLKHAEIFDIESALRHNRDNSKKAIQNYSYALQNECHESTRKRLIEHCKQVNHSGHAYSVKELAELEEKMVLYPKKIACLQAYQHSVIINLMDHAVATDFTYCRDELEYFKEMDSIAGINFIGVSVDGKPVTRQYLMELGCKDCNQAIITMDDLARLPEPRRTLIQNQVDALLHPQSRMKYGLLIKDGVINLVSIWNAAAAGDLEAVATRLAAGAKPDGYAILNAARHGHAEVALLLRNHPDFDIKTLAAAINEARKAGHTDLVKILSATQDVNQPDEYGNILLQHAANKGDVQEVRSLIARGADVNYSGGKMGYPVSIAAAPIKYSDNAGSMTGYRHPTEGHTEILKILLAHGANPNVCIYGDTPMQAAGKAGSLEGLKILLPITEKTPARVYSTDNEDRAQYLMLPWYTKIMFAAQDSQNFLDILKLILAEGADFNQDDENGSHLFTNMINKFNHHDWLTVSETTFKERARADLQSWKVVDSRDDQTSVNKKKYSQRRFMRDLEKLEFLLENGTSPWVFDTNKFRTTYPLHQLTSDNSLLYVPDGYAMIIDKCLQAGFDINMPDQYGQTLLHLAARNGNLDHVKFLIARGANVVAVDCNARTPLHYTGYRNDPQLYCVQVAKFLINHGADVSAEDNDGCTPLDLAISAGDEFKKKPPTIKSRQELMECHLIRRHLCDALRGCQPEVSFLSEAERNELSDNMLRYMDTFSGMNTFKAIVDELDFSSKKKTLHLALFLDPVTHEVMNIPVMLNERVFDLKSLLNILDRSGKDPFTNNAFTQSDIQPAPWVAKEMHEMLLYYKMKHANKSKKNASNPVVAAVASPSATGFGMYPVPRKQQAAEPPVAAAKHKEDNSCSLQ